MAELEATTQRSIVDKPAKASIIGDLSRVWYKSIGEAECTPANRLLSNELFGGQPSARFLTQR